MFLTFSFSVSALENENVKYFKTLVMGGDTYQTIEISEEEYMNVDEIMLLSDNIVTEYKKMTIRTNLGIVFLTVDWKKMPVYRSYDVIALRGENVSFTSSNYSGTQKFVKDGISKAVLYDSTSPNLKVFSNGLGVSMNLVDDATAYTLTLSVPYKKTGNNATIYGTYQHSQADITLVQSQKYTIGVGGYGNVLKFDNSVKSFFDNMSGVSISV